MLGRRLHESTSLAMARKRPEYFKQKFVGKQRAEKAARRQELDREVRNQHGPIRIIVQGGVRKLQTVPVDYGRDVPSPSALPNLRKDPTL